MNAAGRIARDPRVSAEAIFPTLSRAMFAASYPEGAHKLPHDLLASPLLELGVLAGLAEALPTASVDRNLDELPNGVGGKPGGTGHAAAEAIRRNPAPSSWALLRNVEQVPAYAALIGQLLAELEPAIVPKTGKLFDPQGHILISGPAALIPDHVEPGHGILLQLEGEMAMTVFPADHSPDEDSRPGGAELTWSDEFAERGMTFRLERGEAIYIPATAPRRVRNSSAPSISLSIGWRSQWSFAEDNARAFNRLLRGWGFDPRPPGRWPARNTSKSIAWRALRRLPGID